MAASMVMKNGLAALLLLVVLATAGAHARLQQEDGAVVLGRRRLAMSAADCKADKPNYCDYIQDPMRRCVNFQDDNDNCGKCGNVCDKTTYCDGGSCKKGGVYGWCFPAHATVLLSGGLPRRMDQVSVGDAVAVRRPDGSIGYEPIYGWGHRHPGLKGHFVQADLVPAATANTAAPGGATAPTAADPLQLELTPGHFVLAALPGGGVSPKHASDLVAGDRMLVAPGAGTSNGTVARQLQQWVVASVRHVQLEAGMYSPYTLGGNLLVNGALVSSHSAWYADSTFDAVGLPSSWLPALYQATLAPARALWHLLGRERYIALHDAVDARLDITEQCTRGGLLGFLRVLAAAVAILLGDAAAAAWSLASQCVGAVSERLVTGCTCAAALAVASGIVFVAGSKARHLKQA